MKQTKSSSLAESFAQSFIGYWLNIVVQIVIYPFYGAVFTLSQNIQIGLIFMAVSIARGYVVRRAFDSVLHRQSVTEGVKCK